MEPKRARRRIIDSTCVPNTRRISSRGSGQSNPSADSEKSTGTDVTPKQTSCLSETVADDIEMERHKTEMYGSSINGNENMSDKVNYNTDVHNDTEVVSSLFDCKDPKLDCTKSNTNDTVENYSEKKLRCDSMDICNDNALFNDDGYAVSDEHKMSFSSESNISKDEPTDDITFVPVFACGSDPNVNVVQDSKMDKQDDLAEIRNEHLITEMGLDDDNEMCNTFRKFFRPRMSTSSADDIPGTAGDTLICRRHPGLFENPRRISNNTFQFSLDFKGEANTTDANQHVDDGIETSAATIEHKDPFLVELEWTKSANMDEDGVCKDTNDLNEKDLFRPCRSDSVLERVALTLDKLDEMDEGDEEDVYTAQMEGPDGTPRLLSVEEKWQIIFNEKTRAPIYAVAQYLGYLRQFISGQDGDPRKSSDVIRKDGIHPISYLLRKLKLDLKMSYDSFVEEFIKPENDGMSLLVKLLKSIQNTGSQQSGSTNMTQLKNYKKTLTDEHDCLLCIKYSLRIKKALRYLFDINYGLETVAMGVISTFTKSRGTAIEILTLALSTDEGFSRILDCFTYIQLKIGEPVRFKSLINMMNLDSHQNTIFKVSTMKFLNILLDASPNMNIRVYLQHEIETAGLDIPYIQQKASGTGLEFDDLRRELDLWNRRYVDVDSLMSQQGNVTRNVAEKTDRKIIEELQTRVKKLSADKAYLEYQLKSVGEELKKRYEEIVMRNSSLVDKSTQCQRRSTRVRNVGCQCEMVNTNTDGDPLETAAQFFGWKDVFVNEDVANTNGQSYYPVYECGSSQTADNESNLSREMTPSDEEGVVKVKYWLRSNYGSSESDLGGNKDGGQKFYFTRNSSSRRRLSGRTNFPGNWKLIPKSIEQFPSRFPPHQCHKTFCDRCDIRNRPENAGQCHNYVVQSVSVDIHANTNGDGDHVKQTDVKSSQSSDSAIGGSGDRLWNERKIPLLPAVDSEAEILQDLIQPDDSASRCPEREPEPFPDYSSVSSKYNTQKSYRTELSKVLREFESELLEFDRPVKSPAESVEHYITLGEV